MGEEEGEESLGWRTPAGGSRCSYCERESEGRCSLSRALRRKVLRLEVERGRCGGLWSLGRAGRTSAQGGGGSRGDCPSPRTAEKEPSSREQWQPSSGAAKRAAATEEAQPRVKIKKEKEDPAYERCAGRSHQLWGGSEGRPPSRTQREEERRHQRSLEKRGGERSGQEPREEREGGRRGDGHGSRREQRPEGDRAREHRHRGSVRGSSPPVRGSSRC